MIGVLARPEDQDVVREFFELFKTPWELWRPDGRYDVLVDADRGTAVDHPARLVLLYGSQAGALDDRHGRRPGVPRHEATLAWRGERIPVYRGCAPLPVDGEAPDLVFEDTREAAVSVTRQGGRTVVRIGYDLFDEIRWLLTEGQPPAHAGIPTLERHIDLLRQCILRAGVPVVEIPPVPAGHRFIACLTHDVDHPAIRHHRFDHTMFGFLYRAVVGSVADACRGRIPPATLRRNLTAAARLPLVQLGWAGDAWSTFVDDYLALEKGLGSTFFVIPVKSHPGRLASDRPAPRKRAASYAAADIAPQLRRVLAAGGEVALHGIDAWRDSVSGFEERELISRTSATSTAGTRMHWLFWDAGTPVQLEKAGFSYDSTFGYNDTVGLRAGSMQAFKPISAQALLELPLIVMDTALFYPSYLDRTQATAGAVVEPLVAAAERYGGALTVNWHDRSLAPERLWGAFYVELVQDLKQKAAWFPTASQATQWFRARRSAAIEICSWDARGVRLKAHADGGSGLPGLTLRIHEPCGPTEGDRHSARSHRRVDITFKDTVDTHVRF